MMAGKPLFDLWIVFKKTFPTFEDACGRTFPKFGAALEAFDECAARVGKGSSSMEAMRKALDDSQRAQGQIEAGLKAFATCVNKGSDNKAKQGFATMEKAIRAKLPSD